MVSQEYSYCFIFLLFREYESLVKKSDDLKERFRELESKDVKCREDLKHVKNKDSKLQKTIEQEKKHVRNIGFFKKKFLLINNWGTNITNSPEDW